MDDRPAPRGPFRDHSLVAEHHVVARSAAPAIQQRDVGKIQAVQESIVADDKQSIRPDGRSESHGPTGEERPPLSSRACVQCHHLSVGRAPKTDQPARNDGVVSEVNTHAAIARPCGAWRMCGHPRSGSRKVIGRRLGSESASSRSGAPRRPISGKC